MFHHTKKFNSLYLLSPGLGFVMMDQATAMRLGIVKYDERSYQVCTHQLRLKR